MIINVIACANMLHCSVEHLNRLAKNGSIPATKIGRSWIFLEDEVINWVRTKSKQITESTNRKVGRPRKTLRPI
jgi:excisionase family DNA binding protein